MRFTQGKGEGDARHVFLFFGGVFFFFNQILAIKQVSATYS